MSSAEKSYVYVNDVAVVACQSLGLARHAEHGAPAGVVALALVGARVGGDRERGLLGLVVEHRLDRRGDWGGELVRGRHGRAEAVAVPRAQVALHAGDLVRRERVQVRPSDALALAGAARVLPCGEQHVGVHGARKLVEPSLVRRPGARLRWLEKRPGYVHALPSVVSVAGRGDVWQRPVRRPHVAVPGDGRGGRPPVWLPRDLGLGHTTSPSSCGCEAPPRCRARSGSRPRPRCSRGSR